MTALNRVVALALIAAVGALPLIMTLSIMDYYDAPEWWGGFVVGAAIAVGLMVWVDMDS